MPNKDFVHLYRLVRGGGSDWVQTLPYRHLTFREYNTVVSPFGPTPSSFSCSRSAIPGRVALTLLWWPGLQDRWGNSLGKCPEKGTLLSVFFHLTKPIGGLEASTCATRLRSFRCELFEPFHSQSTGAAQEEGLGGHLDLYL